MLYIIGLAKFIKSIDNNIKIAIGGPQATFMPSAAFAELANVDYICRSPGELTLLGIARAIENKTPFEKAVQEGAFAMVDEATERAMYELARAQLQSAGFGHYEISNFAHPGFECRHNRRYWKNLPVIGIGPAAGGWYQNRRTMNTRDIDAYIDAVENKHFAHVEVHTPTENLLHPSTLAFED